MSTMDTMYNPHDMRTFPFDMEEHGVHSHPEDPFHTMLEKLENIHVVLQAIHSRLNAPSAAVDNDDEQFILPLYKSGFGGNWILNKHGRFYLYVAASVATIINVTSSLGAPFILNIPAIALPGYWNLIDLPEGASIILDDIATYNQMNLHVLLTNHRR